ncbi:MAG: hypothetical protein PeribacterA2_0004 [Candidatus Peribacter riflensis]|uniref:Uncharacterized protein n=1 Tax=Candidatus Peribacter riflensis TaxID=1735162 RepID=A0A0S1S9V8_9BACT|nr:MAG: hypothetical protein PeribacterA2_0004 [Candidatus Peribacter riflensis]ALM10504.1 MAG: hypothetical protein PeribacterB2_0004 [Candidatus Peribacter riflensis]ALM11607.1 MAG: hypothetical protein PeribacterC2_0004 [Candidatus Peribacter riflensis]ALM12709.1 MAG: hypothetical protein PeribacterD1_0004 [Candidatus Peribacter riflensis]ALM13810.1 MAG: hypothetical protein PeribacterD2_0004 [Candidatus Peribacter riflensis]
MVRFTRFVLLGFAVSLIGLLQTGNLPAVSALALPYFVYPSSSSTSSAFSEPYLSSASATSPWDWESTSSSSDTSSSIPWWMPVESSSSSDTLPIQWQEPSSSSEDTTSSSESSATSPWDWESTSSSSDTSSSIPWWESSSSSESSSATQSSSEESSSTSEESLPLPPSTSSPSSSSSSRDCCLCLYAQSTECGAYADNWKACNTDPNCEWLTDQKVCYPMFKRFCNSWQAGQTQCSTENTFTVPEEDLLSVIPKINSCTGLTQIRMGHGQGCLNFIKKVDVCIRTCAFECASFEDVGCNVFADEAEADKRIAELQRWIHRSGGEVTVSANQTISNWPECQTRITYNLTAKTKTYDNCRSGKFCSGKSTPVKCQDSNGKVAQTSCCLCGDGDGIWSDTSGQCSGLKNYQGSCTGSSTAISCMDAGKDAISQMRECIYEAQQECVIKRGKFSTTVSPVSITTYVLLCHASAQEDYWCESACR